MKNPRRRALVLAGLQATDLAVTQLSSSYGDAHLDDLGVPRTLRPVLPIIKGGAVGALIITLESPMLRSIIGAGLVAYYSAAVTFHIRAGGSPAEALPAAACAVLAATLV